MPSSFTARIRRPTADSAQFDIYDVKNDVLVLSVPAESADGRFIHTTHFAARLDAPLDAVTSGHIDIETGEVFLGLGPPDSP